MSDDASAQSPRSRLDKIGVAPGEQVGVLAFQDAAFERELAERGARAVKGHLATPLRIVLCAFRDVGELARLATLRSAITPDGFVWALWPKGRPGLREDDIREAAITAGLVDVKVVAFSDVLSGLKLVIPKARRPVVTVPRPKAAKTAAASRVADRAVTAVVRPKREAPKAPDDVAAALAKNRKAKAAWERLPLSHRRRHLDAILEAKRPETRARRIAKMIEMLAE